MAEATSTTELWTKRADAWRASGMRAEVFSQHEGYPAGTLRWWASKLKRELGEAPPPPKSAPRTKTAEVRLARVVREAAVARPSPLVLDIARAGVRIAVDASTDRATLAMVLAALGVDCGARP